MKKVENVLWQAVDWVLYLSMIIMVIVTFANVIGRYVSTTVLPLPMKLPVWHLSG